MRRVVLAVAAAAGVAAAPAWTHAQCQIAKLVGSDTPTSSMLFGCVVAMSGDTLLVGARGAMSSAGVRGGAVYVYRRSVTGVWQPEGRLTASDAAQGDGFGVSVAVQGDVAVVGSWLDDDAGSGSGSAYVFRRTNGVWAQEAKLTGLDAEAGDRFGVGVAVDGDTAVVGAPYRGSIIFEVGTAYVFRRVSGVWAQEAQLNAPTPVPGSFYGNSVAVENGVAAIGALGDAGGGSGRGAVYVYRRSGTAWNFDGSLSMLDAVDGAALGSGVSMSGGAILAGAYDAPGPSSATQGAAYLFRKVGASWVQDAKLVAADGAAGDAFGGGVCLSGDAAIVGAYQADVGGRADQGAAYLYKRIGQSAVWNQVAKVTATDGAAGDDLGLGVAIDGGFAAAGAEFNDAQATDAGAAYVLSVGACSCYANCDGSTAAPMLNVSDFICYMNLYAAGDPQANCDGSTVAPVLNVSDFVCFLNRFAGGCE